MTMTSNLSRYTDYARSSKSPIYGLPAAVGSVFETSANLPKLIEKVSREFQDEIRKSARMSWGDVADSIFVVYDVDAEVLRIFSNHPDAQELEYGGIDTAPKPVLRSAAYSAQARFGNRLNQLVDEVMR